ncbi:MAG: hypothetical protein F7C81_00690 [Desulfurococcales archaeon]|nr:hypothetical protein [Desulfurococcales archaeon]
MARILIAVSSVGLGHVARSRPLGVLLERIYGFNVDYLAPPPTNMYLEHYGIKALEASSRLSSLSKIVDEYYTLKKSGRIGFTMMLREHRIIKENSKIVDDYIDYEHYDAILADESWELLESKKFLKSNTKKIFMTDFLEYPYRRLADIPPALLFNRYLWKRLGYFDLIAFVGFPDKLRLTRKVRRMKNTRIFPAGIIPPMLESEVLDRNDARRLVGAVGKSILVSLGGTSAGLDLMSRICKILGETEYNIHIAVGASVENYNVDACKTLGGDLKFKVPFILKAFDVIISLSGLSSLAASISVGIPTITIPLPGHFEQEENAILASRKYNWITSLSPSRLNEIKSIIEDMIQRGSSPGDRVLYDNQANIVKHIYGILKA